MQGGSGAEGKALPFFFFRFRPMRRAKGRVVSKSPEGDERYPVRRGAQSLSRTWTIVDTCDSVDRPEVVSMVVASCKIRQE